MRLILIRHGQTPANVQGILDTAHPGPGLTALGRRQARALPAALADEAIEGIYVSTLVRTQLTARPLARAARLKATVELGLHEIQAGAVEGRNDRASVQAYFDPLRRWGEGDLDARLPDGESGREFFARYDAAIDRIVERHAPDATVAVVSHGAAIRVWCGGAMANVGPDFAGTHHLDNTGIVIVTGDRASGFHVRSWMGEPVGGPVLDDATALDPTGQDF